MLQDILKKLRNPVKAVDDHMAEQVAEKAAIGARAALAEAPLLDAILDGEPVELVMTLQLRKKAK